MSANAFFAFFVRPACISAYPFSNSSIRDKYGYKSDELAMVGDRIYTDVATAQNAGSLGVLVLSGETTLETAIANDPNPDLTAENIEVLGELLVKSRKK